MAQNKTDYNDLSELRMSAEAFDWLEKWMPEVKDLVLAKFSPKKEASSIGGAIIIAEIWRNRE